MEIEDDPHTLLWYRDREFKVLPLSYLLGRVVNALHQDEGWKLGSLDQGGCPKLVIKLGTRINEENYLKLNQNGIKMGLIWC
jgi:hypothetical protein